MNDDLKAYLEGPARLSDDSYTALQRRALAEMLHLSADVVDPLEAQLETQFETARAKAESRFAEDKDRIEKEYQEQSEQSRQLHETRTKDLRAEFEGQLSKAKVDAQSRRKNVSQSAVDLAKKAETQLQEKIMVAEFVADGAATKYKQTKLETKTVAEAARQHLDMLDAQAARLLQLYRQTKTVAGEASPPDEPDLSSAPDTYAACQAAAEERLTALQKCKIAQLFVGAHPVLLALGVLIAIPAIVGILQLAQVVSLGPAGTTIPIALGGALVLVALGGRLLWQRAKHQVAACNRAFRQAMAIARIALEEHVKRSLELAKQDYDSSMAQKEAELSRARKTLKTTKDNITKQRQTSLREIELRHRDALDRIRQQFDETLQDTEARRQEQQTAQESRYREELSQIQQRYDSDMAACQGEHDESRRLLEERWDKGLACIQALLERAETLGESTVPDWAPLLETSWRPPQTSIPYARFGAFALDFATLSKTVQERAGAALDPSTPASLPALLELPDRCSVLLESQRVGRQQALETLRAVMVRLFTSLPAGRVRFTILDPVGLGESFAGFMHAGDYQESLVGGRIWTETAQIRQQLEDLTGHMENVIQKYLRNEFETIEEYNQQAGELAEPYRFLVIADFPTHFAEEAAQRLSSIIQSGPRCGVHTLIAYDTRQELPPGIDIEDVRAVSVHLTHKTNGYVWRDRVLGKFDLALDTPPAEAALTQIMHTVGKATAESARVEVPFEAIAPKDATTWTSDSRNELDIPLGRTGATRLQHLRLGRGVAQHMLIAGKTGSGKSTLLHVMVTNLALWYGPDQVELYLIDFKQGVEFKTYATHDLPHARAVAIESDREFGLSILQRLDAEMTHRGDLFRQAGVQDIAAYRESTGQTMPRTVLIVDEFQIFFSEDDKLAQDASVLLEQLVRQGRAFGIHVVLGSQTLGGAFGLAHSTMGQMAVRIALQCSEADSQLILDDDNVAARLLARPGEAIYNDVGGAVAGNSPFQTAWLPDATRDVYLERIAARTREVQKPREPMIVFEGSAPAEIHKNRLLATCLEEKAPAGKVSAPRIWLGAPVIIKEPTAVTLRRQSGANLLMVGQRDDVAMNLMSAAVVSLAAQLSAASAQFVVLDGSPADSPLAGTLERVTSATPHNARVAPWNGVSDVIAELAQEVDRRMEADQRDAPTLILLVYALQRYRVLRRSEDSFGFSLDEEAGPRPDAQFATILREGPAVGVHVLTWADTLSTLERTLDRQTMREFDHRVLFQMSATDSSNLIDAPTANQLGFHRALLYSEEQGGFEKFRPYAALPSDWLAKVKNALTGPAS